MKIEIKICGITNAVDAAAAVDCGAGYIGIVCEIAYSPRCVSRRGAAEITRAAAAPVILLLDATADDCIKAAEAVRPFGLQLIGDHDDDEKRRIKAATGCRIWQPFHIPAGGGDAFPADAGLRRLERLCHAGVDVIVVDTMVAGMKGGTGVTSDWNTASRLAGTSPLPVFLAGGITPGNAASALERVRPAGLDVSSGVETSPGVKNAAKMRSLVRAVRAYETRVAATGTT